MAEINAAIALIMSVPRCAVTEPACICFKYEYRALKKAFANLHEGQNQILPPFWLYKHMHFE